MLLAEVDGIDVASREVHAVRPDDRVLTLPYDTLVLATGMETSYFGHDEWEAVAPGLKTLEDARWVAHRTSSGRSRWRSWRATMRLATRG